MYTITFSLLVSSYLAMIFHKVTGKASLVYMVFVVTNDNRQYLFFIFVDESS